MKQAIIKKNSIYKNIMITAGILIAAAGLCEILFRVGIGEQNLSIVMVLSVCIISVLTDGFYYGLTATFAGAFIYDFLVTQPRYGFSFTLGFPITLCIMLAVSLITGAITNYTKREAITAYEKEQRAELMYEINRSLLSTQGIEALSCCTLDFIQNRLESPAVLYIGEPSKKNCFATSPKQEDAFAFWQQPAQFAAAALAFAGQQLVHQENVNGQTGFYYPVCSYGQCYGVLGANLPAGTISNQNDDFMHMIASQLAQALLMQKLAQEQQEALVFAETEKQRNSFLRSISHDLRTPLTGIIGASATLLERGAQLSPEASENLAKGIQTDARWLLTMVENILSVTRIDKNTMVVEKTEEALEEVVAEAVAVFRNRYPNAKVTIQPPQEFLWVPMDAILITQVLNNLLDNAQRHGGQPDSTVAVKVYERNGYACVAVGDDGPGLSEQAQKNMFNMQPRKKGRREDAKRGFGIGLFICKTIITAHGGWIKAENHLPHGAEFTFGLPVAGGE